MSSCSGELKDKCLILNRLKCLGFIHCIAQTSTVPKLWLDTNLLTCLKFEQPVNLEDTCPQIYFKYHQVLEKKNSLLKNSFCTFLFNFFSLKELNKMLPKGKTELAEYLMPSSISPDHTRIKGQRHICQTYVNILDTLRHLK